MEKRWKFRSLNLIKIKHSSLLIILIVYLTLFSFSSNIVSDKFNEASGDVDAKLMKSMTLSTISN